MCQKINIPKLVHTNFKYMVSYAYDGMYNLNESCTNLNNLRVTSVSIPAITHTILKGLKINEIDTYCVQRLLVSNKVYMPSFWDINPGREYDWIKIDYVCLKDDIALKLESEIAEVFALDTWKDKLFYILEKEYGYVLDSLKGYNHFEIRTLFKSSILFGNKEYYRKLDSSIQTIYRNILESNPKLICGVCFQEEDGLHYRLIDGYHRCTAMPDKMKFKHGKKTLIKDVKMRMLVAF